jgi:alpha-beta hydrolase superfamily lysophospholipase
LIVWHEDVLGQGFQARELKLGTDAEGDVIATLVKAPAPTFNKGMRSWFRAKPVAANTDVLYVHGWSDYFFQDHLATFWHNEGAHFFALDLRKYGRSLREGQTPGYVDNLETYFEDIDAAIAAMGPRRGRRLVLMGHSTGGLTLSLWAAMHPKRFDVLILNSPWLEYQLSGTARTAIKPALDVTARFDPKRPMPNIDFGFYTRTVSSEFDGEWDVNLHWRPLRGFPVRTGWLKAVLAGHARVASGLSIEAPTLVMLSTRSILSPRWSPDMARADVAIDVNIVARRAINLGNNVTIRRIDDAMHDVFLSTNDARAKAFAALRSWLRGNL